VVTLSIPKGTLKRGSFFVQFLKSSSTLLIFIDMDKKAYLKEYYQRNKEKMKARAKTVYQNNKEPYLERAKKQREDKESYYQYLREYRIKNRKKLSEYYKNKLKDPTKKLLHNLKGSIRHNLKNGNYKKKHTSSVYLGCSLEQFRIHIESQFTDNMSWENHGLVWHLDHIIPCNAFLFDNEDDLYKCFNYKNYRPMLVFENTSRQDMIECVGIKAKDLKKDLTFYKKWRESLNED
jgi:hypothetical protein